MKFRAILCLTLIPGLSACAVGPDFWRPDAPSIFGYTVEALPAATTATDSPSGDAQTFKLDSDIPGEWWTLFHSPLLNAYIEEALKNNPDIATVEAALRQARENVYAEQGAFYPSINGNFSATREKFNGSAFGSTGFGSNIFTVYDANVQASYNVDLWGGTRREVESFEAQQDYYQYEVEAVYLTLTSNVAAAAIQDASLRGQIAATEEIIGIEKDGLRILNAQFELGGIAKTSVLQQQTTLAQVEANLPPLRKQLAQTRDQLMALMGHFPSEDDGKGFDLATLTLPGELPLSLPSSLVNQRPDIRAAEANLHIATANVGVATANMLPQLTISATDGSEATKIGNLFTPGNGLWSVAGGLAQPIFRGGTLLHERRSSEAALDEAESQYRGTVINAFQNVADALEAVRNDADALNAEVEAERSARESLRLAKLQFDAGSLTYLSLLTSEQQFQQSIVARVQAQAARYADTTALFQALGGGWWNRADIPNEDEYDYKTRKESETDDR